MTYIMQTYSKSMQNKDANCVQILKQFEYKNGCIHQDVITRFAQIWNTTTAVTMKSGGWDSTDGQLPRYRSGDLYVGTILIFDNELLARFSN